MADEKIMDLLKEAPKRKITDIEKQIISIYLEKTKLQRERASATFNRVLMFFALFIVLAFLSRMNNIVDEKGLNILFVLGLVALIVATVFYQKSVQSEEKTLDDLLNTFLK